MGNVVKFEAQGKAYQLSLIERDGGKWVTAQQAGEAMGVKNIRDLIGGLKESGELKAGKHYRRVILQKRTRGNPNTLVLSYRGVIRVAMRAQGSRARLFRDWAEDVLYQVMMTGSYGTPRHLGPNQLEALLAHARREAMFRGIALAEVLRDFDRDKIAKIIHFRRMGLSQIETARALQVPQDQIKRLERRLRQVDIHFDPVIANKRDKMIRETLIENLLVQPRLPMRAEGGAR